MLCQDMPGHPEFTYNIVALLTDLAMLIDTAYHGIHCSMRLVLYILYVKFALFDFCLYCYQATRAVWYQYMASCKCRYYYLRIFILIERETRRKSSNRNLYI